MPEFNFDLFLYYSSRLIISFALCLPIGWEREKRGNSAGFRTFPLVALAACGYTLIGLYMFTLGEKEDGNEALSRVLYGIISGIGFIGGGAIMKSRNSVHGTATAAGIWCAACIGMAVGLSQLSLAFLLCIISVFIYQIKLSIFTKN